MEVKQVIGEHEVNPVKNRDGEVVGAPVFLSPEEVQEFKENGAVEITEKEG